MFEAEKEKKRRATRRRKRDLIAWIAIVGGLIVGYMVLSSLSRQTTEQMQREEQRGRDIEQRRR